MKADDDDSSAPIAEVQNSISHLKYVLCVAWCIQTICGIAAFEETINMRCWKSSSITLEMALLPMRGCHTLNHILSFPVSVVNRNVATPFLCI